jgi:hypothetical protein
MANRNQLAGNMVLWESDPMKTTFEIPDPLFRQMKVRAATEGLKLKELVTSALNAYLMGPGRSLEPNPIKPCPFPLIRAKGGPLMKRMNKEAIAKLEEAEDVERYRRSIGR